MNKGKQEVKTDPLNIGGLFFSWSTKSKPPQLPYEKIKDRVLGKKYGLSLVMIGEKKAKDLNQKYRSKNYPANILSFPLSSDEGEIFICLKKVESESKQYERTYRQCLALFFIHGLLHLKGLQHGSRMEKEEEKILKEFGLLPK